MRNKAFQKLLDEATPDIEIYMRLYGKIVARINSILKEKGITQKDLANKMDKEPSEIHKWLHTGHNFTLRSISKLEAELGETILEVTKSKEEEKTEYTTTFLDKNTEETITTRKATIEDLENLNLLFDAYRIFYKKESDLEESREFLKERIKNNESEIFIAQYSTTNTEKQFVGFVQLYPIFSSTRLKRFWLLNDLFVDKDFRGKGISVLLINEAKKLAIQTNSAGLMLETAKDNIEGNKLYPKTGFELDTEHNFYYWSE